MGVLQKELRRTTLGIRKQVTIFYSLFVYKGWQPPALCRERQPDAEAGLWLRWLRSSFKVCVCEGLSELTPGGSQVTDVTIQR